ncbi:MAG: PaaI family thioesterase [Microscillaceae bacterium]|nr:PaaI family thioesterase [Microscillaceae bacterium]
METDNPSSKLYIQDFMEGNICFGCGKDNPEGLQIKSFWQGDLCICLWSSQPRYQGWKNLMNGGILATLIDCHSMGTALSQAYRSEQRAYETEPVYKYATGTMQIKYLKPTPNNQTIELKAKILEVKGRKTTVFCEAWVGGLKTAEAEVIAIRVFDSSQPQADSAFQ